MADREDRMRQIESLLALAEGSGFTAEAQSAREKAEKLMIAWRIEDWELAQRKPKHEQEKPEARYVFVCGFKNPLKQSLIDLMSTVVRHCGCAAAYTGLGRANAETRAQVVGFPSDIDYVEMMFTSLHVQMNAGLEPKPDPTLSFEENLALLKEAGMKWTRIHEILQPDVPWERRIGVRYTAIYTKFCEERHKTRMYTSPVTYQRNYAAGFVTTVSQRLAEIRAATKTDTHTSDGSLVPALRDRKEQVADFVSNLDWGRGVARRGEGKFDGAARGWGMDAGRRADLGQDRVSPRKELG